MHLLKKTVYLFFLIGYSYVFAGSYEDFFWAVERDNGVLVKSLLDRGFDPNSVSSQGDYALTLALRQSSLEVAQVLIAFPATRVEVRSVKDESPLMLAAFKGELDLCKQLIARDADVNKPGWTPLHYAASAGKVSVLQLLLAHYAYVDAASPNGTTPLMMAAMYGSTESVQVLLAAGADATLKNAQGLTALDFAAKAEHTDAMEPIKAAAHTKVPAGSW